MKKGRLEAFSDGVLAIIITIMVLELKVPHSSNLEALHPLIPTLICYVLSFAIVGIYWSNHHHMFYLVKKVNGKILWANLNLLFWLSVIPFVTAWTGENHFAKWPVILYGVVLVMNAISYTILTIFLIRTGGRDSTLAVAMGKDTKGKISICLYLTGIVSAFFVPIIGMCFYGLVALIWFIPDKRVEKIVVEHTDEAAE